MKFLPVVKQKIDFPPSNNWRDSKSRRGTWPEWVRSKTRRTSIPSRDNEVPAEAQAASNRAEAGSSKIPADQFSSMGDGRWLTNVNPEKCRLREIRTGRNISS